MFSDTHFHFHHLVEERKLNGCEILRKMVDNKCFFGLDIGTEPEDLEKRQKCMESCISELNDGETAVKASEMIHYSAGIWPSVEAIHNRNESFKNLVSMIETSLNYEKKGSDKTFFPDRKIIALGEIGLDHHWNPSGVDGRCESDFDNKTYEGEKELFEMQLEYAKQKNLPVIIHSRDAFEDTLQSIKNVDYHNGIIHCYSYGLEEAKKFLDLGWYISFSGSVTYVKKSKIDEMKALISYIPEDRLLCETDAPYLAPVPCRGQCNTPVLVEHTYNFVAGCRGMDVQKLSDIVDKNIRKLFGV